MYMETYREGIYVRKEEKRIKEAIKNMKMWRGFFFMKCFYFFSIYTILILSMKRKDKESERERLVEYGTERIICFSLRARATTCEGSSDYQEY